MKDSYEPIINEHILGGVIAKDWEILNPKLSGTIRQFLDLSVLQHIVNKTNAHQLWKELSDMCEQKNDISKASLMRKFIKLVYKDHGSMIAHLNDFQGLINQLSTMIKSFYDEL